MSGRILGRQSRNYRPCNSNGNARQNVLVWHRSKTQTGAQRFVDECPADRLEAQETVIPEHQRSRYCPVSPGRRVFRSVVCGDYRWFCEHTRGTEACRALAQQKEFPFSKIATRLCCCVRGVGAIKGVDRLIRGPAHCCLPFGHLIVLLKVLAYPTL